MIVDITSELNIAQAVFFLAVLAVAALYIASRIDTWLKLNKHDHGRRGR